MFKLLFPSFQTQDSGSSIEKQTKLPTKFKPISTSGRQQQTPRPSDELQLVHGRQIRNCSEADIINKLRVDIPYGPVYAAGENEFGKNIKDHGWKHVTDHTPGCKTDIKTKYIRALRSIEREARAAYADGILTNLESNDFINMLLRDTCLFLQLVLSSFGADLGYPPEHPVFGNERDEKTLRKWMASMFIVGNQLPLVVIETLISQSFFRQAIEGTSQWRKPEGLLETVLYEFLLAPALENDQHGPTLTTCLRGIARKPCDLLHALHLMVLVRRIGPCEDNESEAYKLLCNAATAAEKCRSAKELSQAGIRFEGVDGMGIRRIYCIQNMLEGTFYLPSLMIDDNIDLLFKNLKAYEGAQQLKNREIESYLRFMSQLVPTPEDAKILESQGVIKGQIEKLPQFLSVDQPAFCRGAEGFLRPPVFQEAINGDG